MLPLLKKAAITFLLILVFLKFTPLPILAESSFIEALQAPEYNLESLVAGKSLVDPDAPSGMVEILGNTLITMALGAYDDDGNQISQGAVNATSTFISTMYRQPPLSTATYLADIKTRLNLAPPVYAQSPGYDFLSPLLNLWKINRNIAYVFFIIIFVAIGFMIMFRTKLNPQTTISIQLALPKIIIALILVTFSYAISALIVDFVGFLNTLIYNVYYGTDFISNPADDIDILNTLTGESWGGITVVKELAKLITPGGIARILRDIIATFSGDPSLDLLFSLILAFTLFATTLKIFFVLLTKYVLLLLQGVFSPFVFLASGLPSAKSGIGSFFRNMLSAALTFPAVYFLFELSGYIATTNSTTLPLKDLPPLITQTSLYGTDTLLGAFGGGLNLFVALGILMAIPTVPQIIDRALSVQPGAGIEAGQFQGALRRIPIIGSLISG